MNESKMETACGMCVVALTKHIMNKNNVNQEIAYKQLLGMELYKLLNDVDTRLFLETNKYLCKACDMELDNGIDAMYDFINEK